VQAVLDLAAARHMKTTAEGVEIEEQRRLLRSLGCTEMQGFLFSKARPVSGINELICAHRRHARAASA
jgi:EAL domain-containing protein (putative c-di-GMP-specific phosphodiesterase class I)